MLPAYRIPQGPFGVVLNANAGRMTPRLARSIRRVVNPDHVFLTESKEHAQEALRTCVEREYSTVFAGGGDGTIVDTINTLSGFRKEGGRLPAVGVLRLGTGNALAHWLGSGKPVQDLQRFQDGAMHKSVPIRMVTTDGQLSPFSGLGHDAAILNDYYSLKNRFADTRLSWLFSGLTGYALAGFGKTFPNFLRRSLPEVTVINTGKPAWRIGPGGDEVGDPIGTGEVLYRGPCAAIGAATTPQLGYGFRYFPFATRRPGRFHMRVLNMNAVQCVANLNGAWKGDLRHEGCHDFYADRVRMSFSHALPFQVAGDPCGYRDEVSFGLSEFPVTLIGQA